MVESGISTLINKKWAPYTIAGLTAATIVYTMLSSSNPKRSILKGLSHVADGERKLSLQEIYPESFHGEGEYAHFPDGAVKYWLLGPPTGKRIVLIHGLSTPSLIFRAIAEILAKNGFRVLLYDLYGRGYSDCPEPPYTAELYITQLALLMQKVNWEKAVIVGLSMGGGIAAAFASAFSHLVDEHICFIASAGVMTRASWRKLNRFWQRKLVVWQVRSSLSSAEVRSIVPFQASLLPGYVPAIVSSIVEGPLIGLEPNFEKIGKSNLRVQLIWGTKDTVVHPNHADILKALMPQADVHLIEGAGHDLTMNIPNEVAELIMKFVGPI